MIKNYCFFINDWKFDNVEFSSLCIQFLKIVTPKIEQIIGDCELDGGNQIYPDSHHVYFDIDNSRFMNVIVLHTEKLINKNTEILGLARFFEVLEILLMREIQSIVKLIEEAKNARKH